MLYLLLIIILGLVVAYALFVRPVLKALPALKAFYAEADTFWGKVLALGGNSLTIAWGYVMAALGVLAQALDPIAALLGDPELKQQITDAIGASPQALGLFSIIVAAITIVARLRSIAKEAE